MNIVLFFEVRFWKIINLKLFEKYEWNKAIIDFDFFIRSVWQRWKIILVSFYTISLYNNIMNIIYEVVP